MGNLKYILFFLTLFFASTICSGQINFDNNSLKTFDELASKSSYASIKEGMKGDGIILISDGKDRDGNNLLVYSINGNVKMSYCYSEKNEKLIYARMDIPKRFFTNFLPLFDELTAKGFEKTVTKRWAITDVPMAMSYQRKDYPYSYIIYEIYQDVANIFIFNLEFGQLDNFELK